MSTSQWDIEVSEKMYNVMARMFDSLGLAAPDCITSGEMEKAFRRMKYILNGTQTTFDGNQKIVSSKPIQHIGAKRAVVISKLGIIRYQLKNMLSGYDVGVLTVENQYNGLIEYVKKLCDIVIIDLSETMGDALDVIAEIKRLAKKHTIKTRIIVLDSSYSEHSRAKYLEKGVDAYISKEEGWHNEMIKEIEKSTRTFPL